MSENEPLGIGYPSLESAKGNFDAQLSTRRLSIRELFERVDSSANKPRQESLPFVQRDSLIQAVAGSLRPGAYLEIGFGPDPYYQHTPRKFSSASPYIGVDGFGGDGYKNGGGLMASTARMAFHKFTQDGLPPNIDLIIRDGRQLLLPDASVQEVFMGDVILSPGMKPDSMYDLFREARRVLHPETGTLVIREGDLLVPQIDSKDISAMYRSSFGEVGFALDAAGFKQRILLDESDGEDADAVAAQFGEDLLGKQFIIAQPKDFPLIAKSVGRNISWGRRRGN